MPRPKKPPPVRMTADEVAVIEHHADVAERLCLGGRLRWSKGADYHSATFTDARRLPTLTVVKSRAGFRLMFPRGEIQCAGPTIGHVLLVEGPMTSARCAGRA